MIKYNSFVNENLKKSKKPTRKDLAIGKMIKTMGQWDNLDVNNQLGHIIEMKDYGYILIEYLASFSTRLHSGHKDIGQDKHCFYVNIDNIYEIIPDDLADKIKNKQVVPYKASTELLRIFKRMKFEPTEEYVDVSFFDIDKDNAEVITYLPAKRFTGDPDTLKGRQSMKVGRILKKLKPALTEAQQADLITSYWGAYKIIVKGEGKNLDVVTGEDIRYWYSIVHYAPGGGELWSSCMSGPGTAPVFNLYCENPEKIALCVYTNEDDKLMARALVWRLDNGDIYMDRVYAIGQGEKKVLMDYAAQNNMKSHSRQDGGKMEVTLPKDYGGKHRPYHGNPYMDTFRNAVVAKNGRYYLSNQQAAAGTYTSNNYVYN